jgi:hypothetical protein
MDKGKFLKFKQHAINQSAKNGKKKALKRLEAAVHAAQPFQEPNQPGFVQYHLKVIEQVGWISMQKLTIEQVSLSHAVTLWERLYASFDPISKKPGIVRKLEASIESFTRTQIKYEGIQNEKKEGIERLKVEDESYFELYRQANDIIEFSFSIILIIEGWLYLQANNDYLNHTNSLLSDFIHISTIQLENVEKLGALLGIVRGRVFSVFSQFSQIGDDRIKKFLEKIYMALEKHADLSFFCSIIDKESADELYERIRLENCKMPDRVILARFSLGLAKNCLNEFLYLIRPNAEISITSMSQRSDTIRDCTYSNFDLIRIGQENYQLVRLCLSAKRWIIDRKQILAILDNQDFAFKGSLLFATLRLKNDHYYVRFTNFVSASELNKLLSNSLDRTEWVSLDLADLVGEDRRRKFFSQASNLSSKQAAITTQMDKVSLFSKIVPKWKRLQGWLSSWQNQIRFWLRLKILVPVVVGMFLIVLVPIYMVVNKPISGPYLSIVLRQSDIAMRGLVHTEGIEISGSGAILHSGSQFQLKMVLKRPRTIMLLYRDQNGEFTVIDSGYKEKGTHILPSEKELFLLDYNKGKESFLLITCDRCTQDETEIIKQISQNTLSSFVHSTLKGELNVLTYEHQ